MASFGIYHRVGFARTDVTEERIASMFRMERTSELGTLAVTTNSN
jgi:hypothetical protein